jgi:hypothetical protein
MYLEDTYKNPFSDYNANTMDTKQIVDFWLSPFENNILGITERDVASEKTSLIFMGGRGSGKTMLLKHFSFEAQKMRSEIEKENIRKYIQNSGYIGLYIRFDSPLLRSFDGLGISPIQWDTIFTHFFELIIAKAYFDIMSTFQTHNSLNDTELNNILSDLTNLLGLENKTIWTFESLREYIIESMNYVNMFRSKSAFSKQEFTPAQIYTSSKLSHGIANSIRSHIEGFDAINYLILIDEYENFLPLQQKIVNSMVKLSKDNNVAFRIGMRLEGFHTYDTVSNDEFIKENRDYRKIQFDDFIMKKDNEYPYKKYLQKIAHRRLMEVPLFKEKGLTDIVEFLGDSEDYESEAITIVSQQDRHFDEYLKEIKKYYKQKKKLEFDISDSDLNSLRNNSNPLLEMQNLRLLLKENKVEWVQKAYTDYLNKIESDESKKYKLDYISKYKLSYLFVLCSIYKKPKLYYSFNDFCYLSSGIVGLFIELCRCAFQYAYFEDRSSLFNGHISEKIQSKAAHDVAISELDQINKISRFGSRIYCFTKNVGNMLSDLHSDKRIRYPETTQFSIDSSQFIKESDTYNTFKTAIMWSVIQKKIGLQQASIGDKNEEIYILNRIYSPEFGISLRTRGGFNKKFSVKDLEELMSKSQFSISNNHIYAGDKLIPNKTDKQLSFFDVIGADDVE